MRYAIVIEKGPTRTAVLSSLTYRCVAVGKSAAEDKQLIAEAIPLHLEGMQEDVLSAFRSLAIEC